MPSHTNFILVDLRASTEKVTKELLSQKQSQAWQAWVDRARSGAKIDVSPRLTSRRG